MGTRSLLLALMFLAGCAGQGLRPSGELPPAPLYTPPAQGAQATLLLRVTQPGGMYVLSTFENPVSCSKRREFVRSTLREPERIERKIAAGRMQTVSFTLVATDRRACEVSLSFEPARGRTYLMRNTVEADRCHVVMLDVTALDRAVEVPHLRRERVGYGRIDDACKAVTSTVMPAAPATDTHSGAPTLDDFRDLLPPR